MHDFYYLREKSIASGLKPLLLTFTYKDDCHYFKMDIINDIKNYLSLLIRNTKSDIKYYSNIELGDDFFNPHLHCQIYYSNYNQVMLIRDKIIERYGLFIEYCHITLPKCNDVKYDYAVKDYKIKDDKELLLLDDMKIHYRYKLHKSIRFCAFSKEKYSKKIYKKAYGCGILKGNVDYLIDNKVINESIEIIDNAFIYYFEMLVLSVLVQYKNKKQNDCVLIDCLKVYTEYIQIVKIFRVYSYF